MDVTEKVKRANRTFGGGLQAGLDAGRVEVVEAEEGGDLVIYADVVIADGALPGLAAVLGLEQVGPVSFDGVCVVALGVDSEIDDAFLHEHAAVDGIGGVFSDEAGDEVAGASVAFELKLCLDESEHVAIALDLPTHPALPDLDLVLIALDSYFPCRVLNFDAIAIALDDEVDLGGIDRDGGLVGEDVVLLVALSGEVDDGVVKVHFLYCLHLLWEVRRSAIIKMQGAANRAVQSICLHSSILQRGTILWCLEFGQLKWCISCLGRQESQHSLVDG